MVDDTANGEVEKPSQDLFVTCISVFEWDAVSQRDRDDLAQAVWRVCRRDGRSFAGVQSLQIFTHDGRLMIELICRLPLGPVPTREEVFDAVTAARCVVKPETDISTDGEQPS